MVRSSSKWDKVLGKCFVCKDCGRAYLDKKEFVRHKLSHKMSHRKNIKKSRNKNPSTNPNENESEIEVIEISSTTTEEIDDDLQDEDFQIQNEGSGSEEGDDEEEQEEEEDGSGSEEDIETDQVEAEPEEKEEEDDDVVILENEEEVEQEKSVEKNGDKEDWTCQLCHRHFLTSFHLERHNSQCQPQPQEMMLNVSWNVNQERSHVCPYCDKPFDDSSALLRHSKVHTGRDLEEFPCRTCAARFSERGNRDRHELIHIRNALQPFRCSHCGKGFDNEDGWRVHERIHLGLRPYKCRYCPERFFTTTGGRLNHERTHIRNQLQPFHCSHCEKGFDNQEDCTAHERKHLGLNPFKCRFCSRFFGSTGTRDHHEDTHRRNQAKPFHCSRCQKGFDNQDDCTAHERKHLGLKPHKCRFCSRFFATTGTRDDHEDTHRRNQAKPFHCLRCQKGFEDKDACQVHERRHLGLNPHPCRFCSRYFGTSTTRDKHEETHIRDQIKPFHCPICKKGFNCHDYLKAHERKHFGLDPYPCRFCPRYFSQSGNRSRHEISCSWNEKRRGAKGQEEEEQARYFCVYCSKSFSSRAARDLHLRDHTG